jgi:hypothetical protein
VPSDKDDKALARAVDKILNRRGAPHTGRAILRSLAAIPELSFEDARVMIAVAVEDRESTGGDEDDLR